MKIIVGFSKPKSKWKIFSAIIRFFQKTPYSHSYIKMQSDNLGLTYIYQANGSGLNFCNLEIFNKKNIVIKEFIFDESKIDREIYKKVFIYCMANAGKSYSFKQILYIFKSIIMRFFGCKCDKKKINGDSGYICSELVAYILEIIGYRLNKEYDYVTPKDLYIFLERLFDNFSKTQ